MVEERRARANVLYRVKLMNELAYKSLKLADKTSYLFAQDVLSKYGSDVNLMSEIVDMINNMDDMLK